MLLGDNKDNEIILPYATWKIFVARHTDIEQLLQSPASSSLAIQDLVIDLVKLCNCCRYCKIEITRCLLVYEAVDYTIFIHTRTLYWACIFRALSEYVHGQRKI